MELVRWEPFEGLSRLHSRINDLFDEQRRAGRALCHPRLRVHGYRRWTFWKARTRI